MLAIFKRYIVDNEELLKEATDAYYKGSIAKEEFYKSLSEDQLEQVRKHIHIIQLFESIANCRRKKVEAENKDIELLTFYEVVLELLECGEHIDNAVLIDLLKQMGKPKITIQQQKQSTCSKDISADNEVETFRKALYSWPKSF